MMYRLAALLVAAAVSVSAGDQSIDEWAKKKPLPLHPSLNGGKGSANFDVDVEKRRAEKHTLEVFCENEDNAMFNCECQDSDVACSNLSNCMWDGECMPAEERRRIVKEDLSPEANGLVKEIPRRLNTMRRLLGDCDTMIYDECVASMGVCVYNGVACEMNASLGAAFGDDGGVEEEEEEK